jgi:ubiquitin-protein ligase
MRPEPTWIEIRDARLRNDYAKMLDLTRGNDLIRIGKTEGNPPELYDMLFTCRGVASIGAAGPVFSNEHRVQLSMPVEYPTRPPQMRWLTPIFHPNINPEGTYVCVDVWYPSKSLDDLCVMLGRMIQYKNYNPFNPLRLDAAVWSTQNQNLLPVDRRTLRAGASGEAATAEIDVRVL